eukprot:scaffold17088_cov17-Tisochrysis_lutea.AAC.3
MQSKFTYTTMAKALSRCSHRGALSSPAGHIALSTRLPFDKAETSTHHGNDPWACLDMVTCWTCSSATDRDLCQGMPNARSGSHGKPQARLSIPGAILQNLKNNPPAPVKSGKYNAEAR